MNGASLLFKPSPELGPGTLPFVRVFAQLSDTDRLLNRLVTQRLMTKIRRALAQMRQLHAVGSHNLSCVSGLSELGGQVAIDLKADADFHESGGCPKHETFLRFSIIGR